MKRDRPCPGPSNTTVCHPRRAASVSPVITVSDNGEPRPLWITMSGRSPEPVPAAARTSHATMLVPAHGTRSSSVGWSQWASAWRSDTRWARQAERWRPGSAEPSTW